uniref:Uncharacterized protein n=1 Tax=Anguilla anguilla TaxID=7936 RepID=A0A0E9UFD8_ANGAN
MEFKQCDKMRTFHSTCSAARHKSRLTLPISNSLQAMTMI